MNVQPAKYCFHIRVNCQLGRRDSTVMEVIIHPWTYIANKGALAVSYWAVQWAHIVIH